MHILTRSQSPEMPSAEPVSERVRKPYRPDKDLDIVSKLPPRDVCERVIGEHPVAWDPDIGTIKAMARLLL